MHATPTQTVPRKRRWLRRLMVLGGALLVIAIALGALLPWMITQGLGHRWIEHRASDAIAGSIRLDALRITWSGPQSITGLRIIDSDSKETTNLTVTVDASLMTLLFDRSALAAHVTGDAHITRQADGSLNLIDAVRPANPSTAPQTPSPTRLPRVSLTLDGFGVVVTDATTPARYEVRADNMTAQYQPGGDIDVRGNGSVGVHGSIGTWTAEWSSSDPLDRVGSIDLTGTRVDGSLIIVSLPFETGGEVGVLDSLSMRLQADDVTDAVQVAINASGAFDHGSHTTLASDVRINRPLRSDGTPHVTLPQIVGTMSAEQFPTQLLEPFLADTPVQPLRDVGSTVTITAAHDPDSDTPFSIEVGADRLNMQVHAGVDGAGRLTGQNGRFAVRLHPALLAAAAGIDVPADVPVTVRLAEWSIDRRGDGYDMASLALQADVTVDGEHPLGIGGSNQPPFSVRAAPIEVRTDRLADGVTIRGGATIDDARVSIDQHVSNLVDRDGAIAPDVNRLMATGLIDVANVSPTWIERRWPDLAAIIGPFWTEPASVRVHTGIARETVQTATVDVFTGAVTASVGCERQPDALAISGGHAEIRATPEMVAAVCHAVDVADGPALTAPTVVRVVLDPTSIAGDSIDSLELRTVELTGMLGADPVHLIDVPGVHGPITLRDTDALFMVRRAGDAMTSDLQLQTGLHRLDERTPAARLATHVRYEPNAADALRLDATVDAIQVASFEALLDQTPGALTNWLGDRIAMTAHLRHAPIANRTTINAQVAGSQASLRATAVAVDGMLTASFDESIITLPAERAQALLAGTAPDDGPPLIRMTTPVTLTATIPTITWPLAASIANAEEPADTTPFDPSRVHVDATISASPVAFATRDGESTVVENGRITFNVDDLARGIDYALTGSIRPAAADAPEAAGSIDFAGRIHALVTVHGTFDGAEPRINLTGHASALPTALIDILANMDGLLVDALGPAVSLTATTSADGFNLHTGAMDIDVLAGNGSASGQLLGRSGMLHVSPDKPLAAELQLTPPLRARLLQSINPILADLRSSEHPLRFAVRSAEIPVDGDLSALNADFTVDIGHVALDSGSATLAIMRTFQRPDISTIPAVIEPIVARVRAGVLTYDRFALRIDPYTLAFAGQINLNTRAIDLRWHLPLAALGQHVREFRGLPDELSVPLRTRGTFSNYATAIDPDFDLATELIRHGIGGAIRDQLKGDQREPLNRILDILNRPHSNQRDPRSVLDPLGSIMRDAAGPGDNRDR